jgi:hypothetical protein
MYPKKDAPTVPAGAEAGVMGDIICVQRIGVIASRLPGTMERDSVSCGRSQKTNNPRWVTPEAVF